MKIFTVCDWLGDGNFRLGDVSLLVIGGGSCERHSIRATVKGN